MVLIRRLCAPTARSGILVTTFALACAACAPETPADAPPDPATSANRPEDRVHRTVVQLNPDGTQTVHEGFVTRARSLADRAAAERAATAPRVATGNEGTAVQAIEEDPLSCNGTSLWVYNATRSTCTVPSDSTGEICFKGTGTADLHNYYFWAWNPNPALPHWERVPWAGRVTRYYPGVSSGTFSDSTCSSVFCTVERFYGGQHCTAAGSVAQVADRVCLGSGC
jgi:hypothetical protein